MTGETRWTAQEDVLKGLDKIMGNENVYQLFFSTFP